MKIHLSKIERPEGFSIYESLEKGKCDLCCDGEDFESIWVAKDEANNVMYLLNNALNFYPFSSWGMELPLSKEFDILEIIGESVEDTEFSVCPEVYNQLKEMILLNDDDELDVEKYFEKMS